MREARPLFSLILLWPTMGIKMSRSPKLSTIIGAFIMIPMYPPDWHSKGKLCALYEVNRFKLLRKQRKPT